MGMDVLNLLWTPVKIAAHLVGGTVHGATSGIATKALSSNSRPSLNGIDDLFNVTSHNIHNITGGGLEKIRDSALFSNFYGFIKSLLSKEGFKNAFSSAEFESFTKALGKIGLEGGGMIGAGIGLAMFAFFAGRKVLLSERKTVDELDLGWGGDILPSKGFHELKLACGALMAGGGLLTLALPGVGLGLAGLGLAGTLGTSLYRSLVAKPNPLNNSRMAKWPFRGFFEAIHEPLKNPEIV